ncbi:hypothetical protein BC938DRAFT_472158 [Jimgerdemannia flammicorona]|uniref:Uncharacterized protein n=1 Tax=Jimgerdemannia flammicorona TaxID=994334 RepID=A0A433QU33_9FUNG|nr:hypothetical protein BC938DRAFT_472158 [Jimgerdemannia flammicorona]
MLSGNGPSSPTDEATTPKSSSRPTSLHEAALPAPPRPLSIPSEVSPPPSIPQRRASTRSSLPPPPAEPVEFIPDPRSRASIVEEDITEQIKEDEEEIQVTVDATTTPEVEENVEAKQEPDEDAQDDIVEESVLVENTMKAAEDLDDSVNMGEADIHLGREHEESKIDMVEQNDNIVAKEEESPKRPELPELPSGPKLAPTPRARPARGRRAPSEQSIKEAGPSQTAVLENDVTKPTKPIFNKFPTPFAGVKGELPNIPLKPVQRRMFEPVPALPDKEPNATHSEDKDSTTSTAPPAGGVRSLQNRFNFAAPQGSGSNDVLETKLKNFVRQEIDRLKKEFEAQLADERTARQLLEEEIKALKERLSE